MKDAKTQIITAVIAALATILAAWIGKWNFNTTPEKGSNQPLESIEQVIPNQQNQAEKVENNQKKEITVQGDYVEGDKLESRPKEVRQSKPSPKKEVIDSSKNEASRNYENSGSGTQINIEQNEAPINIHQGTPPRTLTQDMKNELLEQLPDKNKPIEVKSPFGDAEARAFAIQVINYLKSVGYKDVMGAMAVSTGVPLFGQTIIHGPASNVIYIGANHR